VPRTEGTREGGRDGGREGEEANLVREIGGALKEGEGAVEAGNEEGGRPGVVGHEVHHAILGQGRG